MAVSDDRKFTKAFVHALLEGVKGKTLGEVDSSHQFARTEKSEKITGIAGDVIEYFLLFNILTTHSQNSNSTISRNFSSEMNGLSGSSAKLYSAEVSEDLPIWSAQYFKKSLYLFT